MKEIAKFFASTKQWDLALEALQYIVEEKERNLLIVDIIEGDILPEHDIKRAKEYAAYLTPVTEMQPLALIRIALSEKDREKALKQADRLPSPLSRNFAFWQVAESYLDSKEKDKAYEIGKRMLENIRTISDSKTRSFVLREIALNLFLANKEKEKAKEVAMLIPDEEIRTQVLSKIKI